MEEFANRKSRHIALGPARCECRVFNANYRKLPPTVLPGLRLHHPECDGRATTDISDAARAATYGAIDTLLVDMDTSIPGTVDENSGAVSFADSADAMNYGVIDEIMGRAINSGARVLSVRSGDLPAGQHLAAILRYAV